MNCNRRDLERMPALLLLMALGSDSRLSAAIGASPPPPAPAGLEALDDAFRFATAIQNDPKDRAKAQELALGEYLAAGAYDEAARRAPAIEGWRRGVVYADLAGALARDGRQEEARSYVDKAEAVRATVEGWQNPRISAHVAEALALLGEREKAGDIATKLAEADPVQYAGRSAATEALALATEGNLEAAMKRVGELEGNDDLDVAWWRTSAYLALARQKQAPSPSRLAALDAARASSEVLPIERRIEALLGAADLYASIDRRKKAGASVREALAVVDAEGAGTSEKIPFLIEIGRAWGSLGERGRARKALRTAERLVPEALSIDRPGLLARIASAYRHVPDEPSARQMDARAVDAAAEIPLSRPRALALSAICRQLGRDRVLPDKALRSRLDQLRAGLGEPW